MWVQSLSWEDPLEEGMATHPGILAWKILWTEESGGLRSIRSQRVKHDQNDLAHTRQSQASPLTPILCSFHHCVRDLSFLKPLGDLSLLKGLIMVILLITSLSTPWTEPEHPGFWPLPSCSISLTKAVLTDTAISTHVFCSLLLNRSQQCLPYSSAKVVFPACDYSYGHKNNSVFVSRFSQMESSGLVSVHYQHPPQELHQNRRSTRKHITYG